MKDNKIKIIGLSGYSGSGKNTVADMIQKLVPQYNFEQKSFANKLKQIICILTGCTLQDLESQEFKNKFIGNEWNWVHGYKDNISFKKSPDETTSDRTKKYTYREMLQLVGTELFRNRIHEDTWCNALFSEYKEKEIWKPIKEYEGLYEVSSLGQVCSLDRQVKHDKLGNTKNLKGCILRQTKSRGYYTVHLSGKNFIVHSLVANAFHIKPFEKAVINHKDGNKENNRASNLEWVSQKDNIIHSHKHNLANPHSKLSEQQVENIREKLKNGIKGIDLAREYSISPNTISSIKNKINWKEKENIPLIAINDYPNWIITDVRFPNEFTTIKNKGGIIVRINNPNLDLSNPKYTHASETSLDGFKFDYVIDNTKDLSYLKHNVLQFLINYKLII